MKSLGEKDVQVCVWINKDKSCICQNKCAQRAMKIAQAMSQGAILSMARLLNQML
jgi:hypothetical protein